MSLNSIPWDISQAGGASMDFYQDQHRYTLAQNANIESDSDEESSWVMLGHEGEIVKLPNEKIFYKVRSRISLDISTPKSLANATPFSVKSDAGLVYITNHRVIYLPARPTETLKSFHAPILNFDDTRVVSSWFGAWSWFGLVKPVAGGGIPSDIPIVELKLTFNDGGHDLFREKFQVMKERLDYAQQLRRETGQDIPTGEDLPRYEPASTTASTAAGPTSAAGAQTAATQQPIQSSQPSQPTQPTPDEPPPDYEEAQAQAVGIRLEEEMRGAAERQG